MMSAVTMEEHFYIEQAIYQEARWLDKRNFQQWLDWLADDVAYCVPSRFERKPQGRNESWKIDEELSQTALDLHLSENNKMTLTARVMRLTGNRSFSEVPPSRTTRVISNVEVHRHEQDDCYRVDSVFNLQRSRLQNQRDRFTGRREDVLRRKGAGFELLQRRVILNDTVLRSPNLSVFF